MAFRGRLGAAALALAVTGCTTVSREQRPGSVEKTRNEQLDVQAAILRAEDRRVVDDALRGALADSHPEVRARAALALGRIGSADDRETLEGLLSDPEAAVRGEAAFALGLLGLPESVTALSQAAVDPDPNVRTSVAIGLGRIHSAGTAQPLEVLLRDTDPAVTAAACLEVWKLPDPDFAVPVLLDRTRADNLEVVFAATYALARLSSAGARPTTSGPAAARLSGANLSNVRQRLVVLASHPSPEVRIQVARGLALPVDVPERNALLQLGQDPDFRVRVHAVRSLSYERAPLKPLERAVHDPSPQVVAAAYEGLGSIGRVEARSLLLDGIAMNRPNWVRAYAIRALGRIAPGSTLSLGPRFLLEDDPRIGEAAILGLAASDDPKVLDFLKSSLSASKPRVQIAAVKVLALGDQALTAVVGPAASSTDPTVRAAVARAAGQRLAAPSDGADESGEILELLGDLWRRSVGDELPVARRAVLAAAARAHPDPAARALLVDGLADPDAAARALAIEGLRERYDEVHEDPGKPSEVQPLSHYREIAAWSSKPHAAIVTVEREGFTPGRFTLSLNTEGAPLTAWSFAQLAAAGFYDGTSVERLVPGFAFETGSPVGRPRSGQVVRAEINRLRFASGTLGLAAVEDESYGSRWFVTLSAQPHLDGMFTALGRVVQNFPGVVLLIEPGDRIQSVKVYEGDGTEPLPPLESE